MNRHKKIIAVIGTDQLFETFKKSFKGKGIIHHNKDKFETPDGEVYIYISKPNHLKGLKLFSMVDFDHLISPKDNLRLNSKEYMELRKEVRSHLIHEREVDNE